ncbi:lipoprotein [Bordetella ansorpii]|uniref:Lipoprotein n=1 Tax=Bordetella ansorpii TaxID=288768 RepID=A0A157SHG3_9BORD|nr:META domain-containing protein [Bordetella ansorpii]SAI69855.1 lipoprotein [Bordetella ansorpii]
MTIATYTRAAVPALLAAGAAVLLAACAGKPAAAPAEPRVQARAQGPGAANAATSADSLAQTSWELVRWAGPDGQVRAVPARAAAGEPVHLTFLAQGRQYRVVGFSGCNRYNGAYLLQGGTLTIQTPGSTRMACPQPELAAFETAYLRALSQVKTFTLDNGGAPRRLAFNLQNGEVLDFVRRADPPTP